VREHHLKEHCMNEGNIIASIIIMIGVVLAQVAVLEVEQMYTTIERKNK